MVVGIFFIAPKKGVNGRVSGYIKGADWYVGSLNNSKSRTIKASLNFLPSGNYTAELYTDAADAAKNPNNLNKQTKTVSSKDILTLKLAAGGGQVMRLVKQ